MSVLATFTRHRSRLLSFGLWAGLVPALFAQSNPNQVATLRWYQAITGLSFPVATNPYGVAFDGANIWVASYSSSTVTKLRASDGAVLNTVVLPQWVYYLAFDGANVWATEGNGNSVVKIRASDATVLGTFPVGHNAFGVAFDGANIWVSNSYDNSVTKLRASDGSNQGTFAVGSAPSNVAFDGASIWVSNYSDGTVTKLRASDGANRERSTLQVPKDSPSMARIFGCATTLPTRSRRFMPDRASQSQRTAWEHNLSVSFSMAPTCGSQTLAAAQ